MADLFRNAQAPSCGNPPRAVDDTDNVELRGTVDIDVLANDSGGDGELAPETLTVSRPPAHGRASVVDGRIRFDIGAAVADHDEFAYMVCTTDRRRYVEATVSVHIVGPAG